MMTASRVSGASPASLIRRKSSRQLTPASTRMRVCPPVTTVLFPLDPDASTVNRTMLRAYSQKLYSGMPGVYPKGTPPGQSREGLLSAAFGEVRRQFDGYQR